MAIVLVPVVVVENSVRVFTRKAVLGLAYED